MERKSWMIDLDGREHTVVLEWTASVPENGPGERHPGQG